MLGTDMSVGVAYDAKTGLTIEVPENVRRNPPCEHAWVFAVADARIAE
jgi:hypothetical protein